MIDGELIKSKHKRLFIAKRLLAELSATEASQLVRILAQAQLFDLNHLIIVPLLRQSVQAFCAKTKFQIMRLLVVAGSIQQKMEGQKTDILRKKARMIQYELKLKYEQIQYALSNTRQEHLEEYRQIKQVAELSLNQSQAALCQYQQQLQHKLTQIKTQLINLPKEILGVLEAFHAESNQQLLLALLEKALGRQWANRWISLQTNFDIFAPLIFEFQQAAISPNVHKRIQSVFIKNHTFYETKFLSLIEKSTRMHQICETLSQKLPLLQQIQSQIAFNAKQLKKKILDPHLSSEALNRLVFASREQLNALCQRIVNECTAYGLARLTKQKEIMAFCKQYENKTTAIAPSPFVYHWQKVVAETLELLQTDAVSTAHHHSIKALLAVQHYLKTNPDMMQEKNKKSDILQKMITKMLRQEGPFIQGIDELLSRLKNRCHKECKILHSPYVNKVTLQN